MFINVLALASALVLAEPSKSQFVVEARFIEGEETFFAPKITVLDGKSVNVINETQTPFVTSINVSPQGIEPVITVLTEGFNLSVVVTTTAFEHVSLDTTIQNSTLGNVRERHADNKGTIIQLPKLETIQVRAFEIVRLGEKKVISCGKASNRSVEFVMRRYTETDDAVKLPKSWSPHVSIQPAY